MNEYKYVQLQDRDDDEALALKRFIDSQEVVALKYIASVEKSGSSLRIYWNTWKPSTVDREQYHAHACSITGASTVENIVNPTFTLAPILQAALAKVRESQIANQVCDVNFEDLDALYKLALIDVEVDIGIIGFERGVPTGDRLLYRQSFHHVTITEKGSKCLKQGFLKSLRNDPAQW